MIDAARARHYQQIFKWVVYTLLIVNWMFYIHEDWVRATHTLTAASGLLDWAREFATSIDELGWFVLLAMFELETYVLEDADWTGGVKRTVHGIRLVCFAMIAHTVFAYGVSLSDLQETVPVEGATSLCQLAGQNLSYVYNLEYTAINGENCDDLSAADQFYRIGDDPVVTDRSGLELERDLAVADLSEAIIWLVIIAAIEIVVRMQERGITGGWALHITNTSKRVLYLGLIGLGAYWASLGHWLYLWDELLWIGGFAAIEMNVEGWRSEILQKQHMLQPGGANRH